MRNIILAIIGLAFAMGFTSGDAGSKRRETSKQEMLAKQTIQEKERLHRRW